MKKLILTLALIAFSLSTNAQTLNTIWTNDNSWGGTSDQVTRMIWKPTGLYRNGNLSPNSKSATDKTNASNGNTLWSKIDTTTLTYSDLPFAILENKEKLFNVSTSLSNSYFYLVVRNTLTGNMEKIKQIEWGMSLCEYKDSVIAITHKNPARVVVYNSNADSLHGFNLGYSLASGFVTGKTAGNYLWIMGNYYSGGWYTFLEKRNIQTGELVWRRNFNTVQVAAIYGDVDTNGVSYVGTYLSGEYSSLFKVDSSNTILWQKNMEYFAFKEVSINCKKNLLLAAGIKENYGYVVGRKLDTGDSLFHFPVIWVSGATGNGVQSIVSDSSGFFYITGYNYTGSTTQCHLRKYYHDTLTGIHEIGNESPENLKLSQNYPNPFNPKTKINFSLSKKAFVTLKVYDILGKEIETLVHEVKHAGNYSVDFNGKNLPSGTYFYKIETDERSETKKMTLVK